MTEPRSIINAGAFRAGDVVFLKTEREFHADAMARIASAIEALLAGSGVKAVILPCGMDVARGAPATPDEAAKALVSTFLATSHPELQTGSIVTDAQAKSIVEGISAMVSAQVERMLAERYAGGR